MKLPPALKKEVAGIPLWIWLIIGAVGASVAYKMLKSDDEFVEAESETFEDGESVLPVREVAEGGAQQYWPGGGGPPKRPRDYVVVPPKTFCANTVCPPGFMPTLKGGKCKCIRKPKAPLSQCPRGYHAKRRGATRVCVKDKVDRDKRNTSDRDKGDKRNDRSDGKRDTRARRRNRRRDESKPGDPRPRRQRGRNNPRQQPRQRKRERGRQR